MTKSDTQIRLCKAPSESKEIQYIMEKATKAVEMGYTAAILIPTQQKILEFINTVLANEGKSAWCVQTDHFGRTDFGDMNSYLKSEGVKIQYVGNGFGSFSENDHRIIIMTYHSAKGLDFDEVFVPFVNSNLFINSNKELSKTLFMVAMTRARNDLYLTYSGYPNEYLDNFKSNCSQIDISSANMEKDNPTNIFGI